MRRDPAKVERLRSYLVRSGLPGVRALLKRPGEPGASADAGKPPEQWSKATRGAVTMAMSGPEGERVVAEVGRALGIVEDADEAVIRALLARLVSSAS